MTLRRFALIGCSWVVMTMLTAAPRTVSAQTTDSAGAATTASADNEPAADKTADGEPTIPSLDQMLKVALERHPDIRAARAELSVAEANLDRTRLHVVKELTSFRDRWLVTEAALISATQELENTKRLVAKGVVTELEVEAERVKVETLQLQRRELEAELPFLIGGNVPEETSTGDSSAVSRQQAAPIAEQILSLAIESYRSGGGGIDRCIEWSTRLMQIQLEAAQTNPDGRKVLASHLQRLETLREIATARFQAARGTIEDGLVVEFAIIEARVLQGEFD